MIVGGTPRRASGTWPVTTRYARIAWTPSIPWSRWPTSATRWTRGGGPPSRLDCLMAYESFERDWHLEKLNQPVIDRVKLAVTNENEKLIQQMIGECDAADRRYEEDLRLDRIASGNPLPGDLPPPEEVPVEAPAPAPSPAPDSFQDAFDVAIRPYEPDAEDLTEEARAWKDWEERSAARHDAGPEPEPEDPFPDRRTTSTAAALAAAVRDAPPPPPVPRASRTFRTKGAREWLARTGFGEIRGGSAGQGGGARTGTGAAGGRRPGEYRPGTQINALGGVGTDYETQRETKKNRGAQTSAASSHTPRRSPACRRPSVQPSRRSTILRRDSAATSSS